MMKLKNLFLSLMALLLVVSAAAQSRKQVRQYYYWVNQAELAICDSNYQLASECYHLAFSIKRADIRDALFAFKINQLYNYDLERACEAFHFLVQAGNKAYDEYGTFLDDTTKYQELWNCMKTISDTTKSLVDTNLHNALVEIRNDDQRVRTVNYGSDELAYVTIGHTDSANYQKIHHIFKHYKDIDEYNSGCQAMLNAVFIHFARWRLTTPNIYYKKMVKNGRLSAANYMQNYDYCYHSIYKSDDNTTYGTNASYTYVINNTLFVRYPTDIKQINKNRRKLNTAETWEDYIKKVMYVYQSDSPFRFYPQQMMFYGDPDVQEQMEKDERARYDDGEVHGVYYEINPKK